MARAAVAVAGLLACLAVLVGLPAAAVAGPLGWSGPTSVDPVFSPSSVACPSASFCMAVDREGRSAAFDGMTWNQSPKIGGSGGLRAISCPSTSFCAAVSGAHDVVMYSGGSWGAPATVGSGSRLESLSCASSAFCVAVDDDGNALTYNGSSWSSTATASNELVAVSCSSSSFCVALGWAPVGPFNAWTTRALLYNGSSWGSPVTIDGTSFLDGISCPTTSFCAAVGGAGEAVTFNGTTWSAPASIGGGGARSVSCPSASFCVAANRGGGVVTYNGSAWGAPVNIDGTNQMEGVSCASTSFCVTLDGVGRAFKYNGSGWSDTPLLGGGGLSSVACASLTNCIAVDGAGRALTYDGSWGQPVAIDPFSSLISISCPSASFCAALDQDGRVLTRSGGSWGAPVQIGGGGELVALSCSSASFCVAIENEYTGFQPSGTWTGRAVTYNGTTWSSPVTVDTITGWGGQLSAVSCVSASFCVAVGSAEAAEYHEIATFNGAGWSAKSSENGLGLASVSCLSTSFCAAVGYEVGRVFNGSSWSYDEVKRGAFYSELFAVSCGSATFCAAVGRTESSLFNGNAWSDAATIAGEGTLRSVACPSAELCVAVDDLGNAYTQTGGAPSGGGNETPGDGGGGGANPPSSSQSPAPPVSAGGSKIPKPSHCRKGFERKKVKGKAKCVRRGGKHKKKHGKSGAKRSQFASSGTARRAASDDFAPLSAGSAENACVQAGTAIPGILDGGPWLNHPGDRKTQGFTVEADYRPLPDGCTGFRRSSRIKFQIQDSQSHAQWVDAGGYQSPVKTRDVQEQELEELEREREEEGGSCWRPIPGGEKNICRIELHVGNDGGIAEVYFSPPRRLHEPSYARHDPRLYLCTPGKGVTHVRALFQNTVTSSGSGKVVGQRTIVVPVRVRSYPGKGPMRNAWRGAVRGPC